MISLENVALQIGGRILFTGVNLQFLPGNRYAIVGANGAGKSTLLRLISATEDPSDGIINRAKSLELGWLQQDQHKYDENTLIETVMMGRPLLWQALLQKEELLTESEFNDVIGMQLAHLEEIIQQIDYI